MLSANSRCDPDPHLKPRDSRIFLKGNPGSRGETVPRRFPEILADKDRKPFRDGSGRLELARAIATRDNPLTARVLVNRLWLHHFGEPLVGTPDDFGMRSEPPSHPEMLDYLATWFMDNGWSIKKLHKLMMESATYRQSSEENPRYAQIDPGNRWYWQMNRRRLDFEALRDAILAIGGRLDTTMGGRGVQLDAEPYPTRRSVYAYIDRNELPSMFQAFDFANPNLTTGRRDETIVPQQALFMMNSPLVVEQARNLTLRPDFKACASDEDRVRLLYRLVYQREPADIELRLAVEYVRGENAALTPASAGQAAWEYGYGQFNGQERRVDFFVQLPRFRGNAWTVSSRMASGGTGSVTLTADGGVPGIGPRHAAIRRWHAPRDGFISIDGTFGHSKKANGAVNGLIVSSGTGLLGSFRAQHSETRTGLPRVLVRRGDTIDFVTLGVGRFTWAPRIAYLPGGQPVRGEVALWDARKDFSGTLAPKQLQAWEKFAQVLFETNELTFVN